MVDLPSALLVVQMPESTSHTVPNMVDPPSALLAVLQSLRQSVPNTVDQGYVFAVR
jgi:hypothetical protein